MPVHTIQALKSTSDGKNNEANIKIKSKHCISKNLRIRRHRA